MPPTNSTIRNCTCLIQSSQFLCGLLQNKRDDNNEAVNNNEKYEFAFRNLNWNERGSYQENELKNSPRLLSFSTKRKIQSFHVVVFSESDKEMH